MRAAANLKLALACGFTGVIGAGAPRRIDACMKQAIAEGTIPGPRIMAGSRDVSSTGHSADQSYPTHWQVGTKGAINVADGADGFRRAVREEVKMGAEIIKVFATDGHATGGDGSGWAISKAEFAAAVEAADERKVKVRSHIANREAILYALDLGVHIIDHGDGFDDACIERMLAKDAYLTPEPLLPGDDGRAAPQSLHRTDEGTLRGDGRSAAARQRRRGQPADRAGTITARRAAPMAAMPRSWRSTSRSASRRST